MKSLCISSPSSRSYDIPRLKEVELMLSISSPRSIELFSCVNLVPSFNSKGLASGSAVAVDVLTGFMTPRGGSGDSNYVSFLGDSDSEGG